MRRVPRRGSEEEVQDQILRYINMVDGAQAFEFFNSGVYSKAKRRFQKKSQLWRPDGIPDVIAIYLGEVWWIEIKRPKSFGKVAGKLSPKQIAMHKTMKAKGWNVATVWTVKDVLDLFAEIKKRKLEENYGSLKRTG